MSVNEDGEVRTWLDALRGLDVHAKKMFGCYCLYCDGQAVGWISEGSLSLREVGLDYIPAEIRRPAPGDSVQEYVVTLDYASAEWLPRAVEDTARLRGRTASGGRSRRSKSV